ncbi:MAG: amidohydrolase family protein, partial [Longimicrobiales bacterium]|nr:amidohydrolase family protein [Longimicrobiales bacterium]
LLPALLLSFPLAPGAAALAAQEPESWDVTATRGETREIDFTTEEGTWLSVDVSPDGTWMVFDLLGHVYRAPTDGSSDAVALTQESGAAMNYHPRISPDGATIAFISDRGGQDNLWLMDADGSDPRIVFRDRDSRASLPAWTPDGNYLLVTRRNVGAGGGGGGAGQNGIWMYHRDGGSGVQLVEDGSATWASPSPDGRYVYFQVRDGSPDALAGHYQIRRFDRRTGVTVAITAGDADGPASSRASSGGGFAPEISPDGRWLAFGRQIPDGTVSWKGHIFGPRTALWLRDLETGAERVVMDPVAVAIESGSKSLRILPGYAWERDGSALVLWEGGRIRRVAVATGNVQTLSFRARVRRTLSGLAYRSFRITDDPFPARFMRWQTAAPDGETVAFQAVGRIWLQSRTGGEARRLTPAGFGELQEFGPAWSPDGHWIAFTTWHDTAGGHVWKIPAGGGQAVRLTREAAEYVHPAWSPDGRTVVAARGAGATRRGRTLTHNPWWDVVTIPADGGAATRVTQVPLPAGQNPSSTARRGILAPSFGPDGRIFFPAPVEGEMTLVSVRADGSDERHHLVLADADEMTPSPDGEWVAFQEGDNVYLTRFPYAGTGGEAVEIDKRNGRFPVRRLSLEGGLFPRWRADGQVEFGSGDRYFVHDPVRDVTDTVGLSLRVERDVPAGRVAFTGARIITLEGDEVIESGTLVVDGARISCVGRCDTSGVAEVVDASGKTLIPGFVDMHSHHYREHRGYRPLRDYELAIYLAYGVTTSLDNSMWSQNIFPTAEMVDAGRMIGPRTFSTGDPLYRGDAARQNDLSSLEETAANVRRLKSWGAVSIKQYMQPRRAQRQWVSEVAREQGLMVTAEGGDLFYNLGMIIDGQTAWEHPLSYVPLFGDVTRFFGRAGIVYSPTFVVAGPGPSNIDYWFAQSDVWQEEKQRRWMPWRMNAGHLRRRTLRPDTDYSFPLIAQGLADIIAEGGYGAIGSHGEHHGPDAQWEVWMLAAGMSNLEALRVASLHGAHFLGAEEDLGSLRPGKLADLLVLDGNPLEDIRNTARIRYVVKGGVVYEADTLDEVWPRQRPFGPNYWLDDVSLRNDVRPVGGN